MVDAQSKKDSKEKEPVEVTLVKDLQKLRGLIPELTFVHHSLPELLLDDVSLLKNTKDELDRQHNTLTTLLRENSDGVGTIGYKIEQITNEMERTDRFKTHGIENLEVRAATREEVIQFHHKYYREDNLSTGFVERMPGIIVCLTGHDEIRSTVTKIELLKKIMLKVVKLNARDKYQRHEFIHTHYPRIMTDQVRRNIKIFETRLTHCWFNWTNRPTPLPIAEDTAEKFLEGKKDMPPLGFLNVSEWEALIKVSIDKIKSGDYESIQQLKHLQLLPIMTYKYVENEDTGQTKRFTANANVPYILLGQLPKHMNSGITDVPKVNGLRDFNKEAMESKKRKPRVPKKRECIIKYFNLHGVLRG